MARKNHNHPFDLPPLELECMKALWALGKGTIHEIRGRLMAKRPLAYTTVMTVMDRLARKGVVEREKRGRAHLYHPGISERLVLERAIARLAESFFQGSRNELRRYLATGETKSHSRLGEATPSRARETTDEGMDTTLL